MSEHSSSLCYREEISIDTLIRTALIQSRALVLFLQDWSSYIASIGKHVQLASTVPRWGLKPGCAPDKKLVVGLLKTWKS